jgi:hypothetical protein
MSVAYFIVLENETLDFDTFVNGKNIAHAFDELVSMCKKYELKSIEDFVCQDVSEFLSGELDDVDIPAQDSLWFEAQEGIDWATSLIDKIRNSAVSFEADPVIEDLNDYIDVFNKAKKHNAKWRFELDF